MTKSKKVFCIGFMKTGTTTMNRALKQLGYRVSHKSWRLLKPIVRNDWDKVKTHAMEWDALEDNPIPLIYEQLDNMFPGSKFILTVRDAEDWYRSVSYHIGDLRSPMHEWLFGRGKGLPKDDKAHTLAVYNAHIDRVKSYFKGRESDLLIIDITKEKNWSALCTFLNEPPPEQDFPHANSSNFSVSKHQGLAKQSKYGKKRLLNPLKIWYFNAMGYLPNPKSRL